MLRWAVLWDSGMRGKTYLTGEAFLTQVGFSQPPSWSHEASLLAPWGTHSACLLAWPPCHSFPHLCPSCSLGRSLRPKVTSPSSSYPSAQSDAWCAAYSRLLGMYTEIRSCWEFQQGTQGFWGRYAACPPGGRWAYKGSRGYEPTWLSQDPGGESGFQISV